MRLIDWSSDVCSSYLVALLGRIGCRAPVVPSAEQLSGPTTRPRPAARRGPDPWPSISRPAARTHFGGMLIAKSLLLFALAAAAEIGRAWLVWQGVREHKGRIWIGAVVIALALYGFVAPLPPAATQH